MSRLLCVWVLCCFVLLAGRAGAQTTTRPAIRAITAFVKIDRQHYADQMNEALAALIVARDTFAEAGFMVQSVRLTTQPFPEYVRGLSTQAAVEFLRQLDALAAAGQFGLSIGPAMQSDADNARMMEVLAQFLAGAQLTNASAHMLAGRDHDPRIQWRVIDESVRLIQALKNNSPGSAANFNFAATALVEPYAPFFPASWHAGPGRRFSIALQSANVMKEVFVRTGYQPERAEAELIAELGAHAGQVEALAQLVQQDTGWKYLGIDPSAATFADVASVGSAMEAFVGSPLGASGHLTAAETITSAVRSLPVKQVGMRGLMVPVLEDATISTRFGEGRLSLDSLLSYSSVCGTGLDTVPLPGDATDAQLKRMLGDVATLSKKWKKALTARLLPIKGLSAGDRTAFNNPFLVDTILQPLP